MPIRPSERARYPADWSAISATVRDAAGQRCEQCGAPNGGHIRRGTYEGRPIWREAEATAYEDSRCALTGAVVAGSMIDVIDLGRPVRTVLTVAHLDHQPENCDRANLRALCQRCHLAYDAPLHARNAAATRPARRAVGDLFEGTVHG